MDFKVKYSINFPYSALGDDFPSFSIRDYVDITGKPTFGVITVVSDKYDGKYACDYECFCKYYDEWHYFYLKILNNIQNLIKEDNIPAGILAYSYEKGEWQIYEFSIINLCKQFENGNWKDSNAFLLWGIEPPNSNFFEKKVDLPVLCRGAIYSQYEEGGVECLLNYEDGKRIGLPIETFEKGGEINSEMKCSLDIPCLTRECKFETELPYIDKDFDLKFVNKKIIINNRIEVRMSENFFTGGFTYSYPEPEKVDWFFQKRTLFPEMIYFCRKILDNVQSLAKEGKIHYRLLTYYIEGNVYKLEANEDIFVTLGYENRSSSQTLLLFGLEPLNLYFSKKNPCFPIECTGVIYSINNGADIGWLLDFEDGKRIGIPIEALERSKRLVTTF